MFPRNSLGYSWSSIARAALIALAAASLASGARAEVNDSNVKFAIPVLPELSRYLDLLTAPGIAALVLENNGLHPSLSSKLTIHDRASFSMRSGMVRFTGRKGSIFKYEAVFNLSLGVADSQFTFPVELDTGGLQNGSLNLRIYIPLARYVPEPLLQRIQFKLRAIGSLESQKTVMAYLDQIASEQRAKGKGFDGVVEAVALDAYNRSGGRSQVQVVRDKRATDVTVMVIALLIVAWLIGFPLFLLSLRSRRTVPGPK